MTQNKTPTTLGEKMKLDIYWIDGFFFYCIIFIAVGLGGVLSVIVEWKIGDGIAYMVLGFLIEVCYIFLSRRIKTTQRRRR